MSVRAPRQPPMDARMRDRRREVGRHRARQRRRVTLSVVAVVALLGLAVAVSFSPLFAVTRVEVHGTGGERAAQVRQVAAVRPGQNLLRADLRAARLRIERLPWIAASSVRRIPPATVRIDVDVRLPAAVVRLPGSAWLVDAGGVVLGGGTRRGLPTITAPASDLPGPGERALDPALRNALAVRAALPRPLRDAVTRMQAPSVAGLRLDVRTGQEVVQVRFGAAHRVGVKARVLALLLARVRSSDLDVAAIDVRAPASPVLVPS